MAVAALGASSFPAARAAAQSTVPCTAIVNDTERLACYDRALRPAPGREAAAATAAAPAQPTTPATTRTNDRRAERNVRDTAPTAPPAAPAARSANRASEPEREIVPIIVVEVRTLRGRGSTFITDAGDSWVQTGSEQVPLPDAPFDAELRPGAMSSYFLVPKDRGRAIRVRRAR